MADGPNILWTPHPKQAEFLAASEDEVLFGGGVGGGKSDCLLIDALGLQQQAVGKKRYRALLIRRTTPELRELIDRSRLLYPFVVSGAKYHEQAHEWQFPSGAKIIFGYCEREQDVYRYQGQEYQWIGVDELGHFPTPFVWQYLGSRLRTTDKTIKCYMRASCNPGPKWIREYFGFSERGEPSRIDVNGITRRFIPALLADNPSLPPEYRQRLQTLPDDERHALLEGRWDVISVPGAIYGKELKKAEADGRITTVPVEPQLRVNTYWDLGVGDSTAIWFCQLHGSEKRFVDFYEASGEGLPFYAKVLEGKGYLYGTHYAPHDIRVRELGSGLSRIDTAASLGINFEIAPQMGLEDGIHAARLMLETCWFDAKRCEAGLVALHNYRRDYNLRLGEFKATPVHDWSSHAADAFRYAAVSVETGINVPPKLNFRSQFSHAY